MRPSRKPVPPDDGQIIILFALFLVVLLALAGLLYAGAGALVARRQLQNAGDAGALAGADVLLDLAGCSATGAGNTPRAAVTTAVTSAVQVAMPGLSASRIHVTCPTDYHNYGVQVDLTDTAKGYFAGGIGVATTSAAINGQVQTGAVAVALLDPSNPNWTSGGSRSGCSSYTVNGGVTVTYEGDIVVDSSCTLATSSNGAVKALNNSFSMSFVNDSRMWIVGQAGTGTLDKITPTPTQNYQPPLPDPLSGIRPPCAAGSSTACLGPSQLPARNMTSTGQGWCTGANSDPCVLYPGTYSGGLLAGAGNGPKTLLLRPGVYFINGGGFQLKSGSARIASIPKSTGTCGRTAPGIGGAVCSDANARLYYLKPTTTTGDTDFALQWQRDCPSPTSVSTSSPCGVLIYNAPSNGGAWSTNGNSADTVDNGAQGSILLRAYDPDADQLGVGATWPQYRNLVMWQARLPKPDKSNAQPVLKMTGGACVTLSGTVYAPGAQITFGGSSCGSGGGGDDQLTLQFIAWDLTLAGSNNFYFAYRRNSFATPYGYGLVK